MRIWFLLFVLLSCCLYAQPSENKISFAQPEAWAAVKRNLESESAKERRQAIMLIGKAKIEPSAPCFPEIFPLLRKKLADSDRLVRAAALWALAQYPNEDLLESIRQALSDPEWEVRCAAINALVRVPEKEKACPLLFSYLDDPQWAVRYAAVKQVGEIPCSQALAKLRAILQNPAEKEIVRAAVCRSLGYLLDLSSLPLLIEAWQGKSQKICLEAEEALCGMASVYPEKFLVIFEDRTQSPKLRYDIGILFGKIRAKRITQSLYARAQDETESDRVRYVALLLLADFEGNAARSVFHRILAQKNPALQELAILSLGKIQDEEKREELFSYLGTPLREAALWSITQLDPQKSSPFIQKALESENLEIQKCALRLIATMKRTEFIEKILPLAQKAGLKEAAEETLKILSTSWPKEPSVPKKK